MSTQDKEYLIYCNHCQPCPAGIDVGLVNKYYDLVLAGDKMAANHYEKLTEKANARLKKLVAELSLDNAILKDVDLRECSIIEADMILNELYTSF